MARRAQIIIDAKNLDTYRALIDEIKTKGYPIDENTTTVRIHALAEYEEKICKDLGKIEERLKNYIAINGNKRVAKNELCKILRISRPTLNRWIEKGFISWNYLGASFDLLRQWLLVLHRRCPDDNEMLKREFWGDDVLDVFGTDEDKFPPISRMGPFYPSIISECQFCRMGQEATEDTLHDTMLIIKIERVKACEKRYRGSWVEFWDTCEVIQKTVMAIRGFKIEYQKVKYRKHNNGFPATMNLMAFLQQIKRIKNNA